MMLFLLACTEPTPTPTAATSEPPTDTADTDPIVDTDVPTPPAPPTPTDAAGFAASVQADRYQADLEALAVPRGHGGAGWQAAQDRCRTTFEALGYETTLHEFPTGTNVIGRKPGTASTGTIVVSAHYDSVAGCEGADDNASGVAGVLEVARVLAPGTFTEDLVLACWDREEDGLVGSRAWVQQNTDPILMMWSFEMIGYTDDTPGSQSLPFGFDLVFPNQAAQVHANDDRGDFATWVGNQRAHAALQPFQAHAEALGLPVVALELSPALVQNPFLADLQRSDHASFWSQALPGVMVTDSANFRNANYHCTAGEDTVERLDRDFAAGTIAATVGATVDLLGL